MKKKLSSTFNSRQFMQTNDLEIFYYHDINLNHISCHQHEYYEFYFFLEGNVEYQTGSLSYPLQYGDYLLIPPGVPHRPIVQSTDVPYRRFVLWMSCDFYQSLQDTDPDFSYGFDYTEKQKCCRFQTDFITGRKLQGLLMDILEEKNSSRAFRELRIRTMAASFLLEINRLVFDSNNKVSPSYEHALYLNICDYINNHLNENLSLDTLASFFYVSKFHISHIFKDSMGISLHQYIVKKRLQASKNGILSGIPFNQVIYQYGFHDYTSFYRAFKKEFGLSPKEFCEQHRVTKTASPMF